MDRWARALRLGSTLPVQEFVLWWSCGGEQKGDPVTTEGAGA